MEKLTIDGGMKNKDTLTRTIRISGEMFDKIDDLAYKNKITFNNVVNQLLVYALKNVKEDRE